MESVMTSWVSGGLFLLSDEGGEFNPLGKGEPVLYFWTLVVFALLLVILTKFLWGPIMRAVSEREDRIKGDLDQAEEARREAEQVRDQHKKEMEAAAQGAKAILDEARERAESLRVDLERQAREGAEGIIAKARGQIEAEKTAAMQEIREQVVDLSVEITKRIVDHAVDREDHLRMAEELIPKVREM